MSSQEHEGSGDDLDLNLLSMLTKHVFPYYIRSGLVGKKKERKKEKTFKTHLPKGLDPVGISGCNSVNSGGPTSISQHNLQQFHS